MSSITSAELNYLGFRYLQESGYLYSGLYTQLLLWDMKLVSTNANLIPPGALISFVQNGLQYLEMEANLSNSDVDMDEDFSFLQPTDLITKNVYQLGRMVRERKKSLNRDRDKEKEIDREREKQLEIHTDREMLTDQVEKVNDKPCK